MRPIDADALFDAAFKVWGTEADGGETNLFMEMINNAPTIAPPPNDPLTLEQLREMDGDPVWCCDVYDQLIGRYGVVWAKPGWHQEKCNVRMGGIMAHFTDYGKTWRAYRRRPEEGTT